MSAVGLNSREASLHYQALNQRGPTALNAPSRFVASA